MSLSTTGGDGSNSNTSYTGLAYGSASPAPYSPEPGSASPEPGSSSDAYMGSPEPGSSSDDSMGSPEPGSASPATDYPVPNDIKEEVEVFETSNHSKPDVEDLSKQCDEDPEKIFEYSKGLIRDVDTEKNRLLDRITSAQEEGNISEDTALDLKEKVNSSAHNHKCEIKETSDTAVECIDDTSDTEDFIFEK